VPVDVQPSLADGLAGNIEDNSITFDLLQQHVRDIALVEEPEIAAAMRWLVEHEHVLVEGSAAVGVAALLGGLIRPDGPVVAVLTGRNVSSLAANS
jgi:threonine dehydratase